MTKTLKLASLVLNNDISALELLNLSILIFSHPNKGNDYCVHKGR